MAQSRLEKIGTIYTRVTGLLRSGAMKPEDKPIWYDLYEAFPPKLEPRYDRPAANVPIRNIFYKEDAIRAKFHKCLKQPEMISLLAQKGETQSQQFIKIYDNLKSQGALDDEKVFETAMELLNEKRAQMKIDEADLSTEVHGIEKNTLARMFTDAKEAQVETTTNADTSNKKTDKPVKNPKIGGIDLQNLFKD
uniref:Small ribosomal subunit protein mS23 n=1 Tax=Glossina brevipalpis TaxID=37001 RepID=A0A1A9X0R9_9MUSC